MLKGKEQLARQKLCSGLNEQVSKCLPCHRDTVSDEQCNARRYTEASYCTRWIPQLLPWQRRPQQDQSYNPTVVQKCINITVIIIIMRLHRSITHVDAAHCYKWSTVVHRSWSWALQKPLNRSICRLGCLDSFLCVYYISCMCSIACMWTWWDWSLILRTTTAFSALILLVGSFDP